MREITHQTHKQEAQVQYFGNFMKGLDFVLQNQQFR